MDEQPMAAGREIDALIAERIMGLNVVARDFPCGYAPDSGSYQGHHFPYDDNMAASWWTDRGPVYLRPNGTWPYSLLERPSGLPAYRFVDVEPVPFYSTDIAAAWRVVEEITQPKYAAGLVSTRFMLWWRKADLWADTAADAALLICRAALAALEAQ